MSGERLRLGPWSVWDPRAEEAGGWPKTWVPGNPTAVLVDDDLWAPGPFLPHTILTLGRHFIAPTTHPLEMARELRAIGCARQLVPALLVQHQADLGNEALRAFWSVPATPRALVMRPRERIDLTDILARVRPIPDDPHAAWLLQEAVRAGTGDGPRLVDVVVVQGGDGPKAWPLEVEDVLALRCQARAAGVPFAFLGWGTRRPEGQVGPGHLLNGKEHLDMPKSWIRSTD